MERKELAKEGNINLLTSYIMCLTTLQEDLAEDIAFEVSGKVEEIVFERINRYRETDGMPQK